MNWPVFQFSKCNWRMIIFQLFPIVAIFHACFSLLYRAVHLWMKLLQFSWLAAILQLYLETRWIDSFNFFYFIFPGNAYFPGTFFLLKGNMFVPLLKKNPWLVHKSQYSIGTLIWRAGTLTVPLRRVEELPASPVQFPSLVFMHLVLPDLTSRLNFIKVCHYRSKLLGWPQDEKNNQYS